MSDVMLGILIGIVVGVGLTYIILRIAALILVSRLEDNIEKLQEAIEKHKEENAIPCRVEMHDEVFFVYNNDTNEFMAQGSTLAELREHIKTRWSNKKVSVVAGEESVLEILRTQLNESSSSQ